MRVLDGNFRSGMGMESYQTILDIFCGPLLARDLQVRIALVNFKEAFVLPALLIFLF
jgi:hypothetical protein